MVTKLKIPPLKSWDKVKEVNNAYNEAITQAKKMGIPVVLYTAVFPVELIQCFNVVGVPGEWYGSICGNVAAVDLLEAAERSGYNRQVCAYSRMCIGSAITGRSFLGEFPEPDAVLGIEGECNLHIKWFEAVARYCNAPFFAMDAAPCYVYPLSNWGEVAERAAVEYFLKQEYDYIDFMEKVTGQKLKEENLINAFITARRNGKLWDDISDLWRAVPSPISIRRLFTYENLVVSLLCKPQTTEVFTALKEELTERVEQGIEGVPGERIRLFWDAQPPWYNMKMLEYFEKNGAVFVVSPYLTDFGNRNYISLYDKNVGKWLTEWHEPRSLEECLWEIAKFYTARHTRPRLRAQIAEIIGMAKEGKVDGLVWHYVRGCKNVSFGQLEKKSAVQEALGLPGLLIEGSPADPREFSESSVRNQIDIFLGQILADKESER